MPYPVSTSIHFFFDPGYRVPVNAQIERICRAGFRYLDFNFPDWHADIRSPFVGDDWERWIDGAGETAAKCGAVFNQAHAPVQNGYRYPGLEDVTALQRRAIRGCGRLGIPWMVYHAKNIEGEACLPGNIAHFKSLLDDCHKYNVGIAVENIWPVLQRIPLWRTETLIELVDTLNDPLVGICWDTGHGNMTANSLNARVGCMPELLRYGNQYKELTKIGKRLKALHIDDNTGMDDDHIAPFEGIIDWDSVMRALRDIGYEHSFTYECHNAVRRVPECMKDEKLAFVHRLGEMMVRWDGGFPPESRA